MKTSSAVGGRCASEACFKSTKNRKNDLINQLHLQLQLHLNLYVSQDGLFLVEVSRFVRSHLAHLRVCCPLQVYCK
jgi:hypothetical protein